MRLLFRTALGLAVATLLAVTALLGWLAYAPLPLDFAKDPVQAALPEVGDDLHWQVRAVDLAWGGWRRGVQLRAKGTRLLQADGSPALSVPIVAVRFALRPLLNRQLEARSVEVIRPRLELVRNADGSFELAVGSPKKKEASPTEKPPRPDILPLLLDLVREQADTALRRISIEDAEISLDDKLVRGSWFAQHVSIDLGRVGEELIGTFSGAVQLGQDTMNIRANGQLDLTDTHRLAATVDVDEIQVRSLKALWPRSAAADARRWVLANITRGVVTHPRAEITGQLDLSAASTAKATPLFRLDDLGGTFQLAGLSVRFVDTMPAVTEVQGRARFSADGLDFDLPTARLADLDVRATTVVLSGFQRDKPRIVINATAAGTLPAALTVLDYPPLEIARAIDIDPVATGGTLTAQLGFDFFLDGDIDGSNLGLDATGTIAEPVIPDAIGEWDVGGGRLELAVDDRQLNATGEVGLEGSPVKIDWHENLGDETELKRKVTAHGTTDTAMRRALGFDWDREIDGPAEVDAVVSQPSSGEAVVELRADLTQARLDLGRTGVRKEVGAEGSLEAKLSLVDGVVSRIDSASLRTADTHIEGSAAQSRERWRTAAAQGEIRGAGFRLALLPGEGRESFELTSDDASLLLREVDLYAGGRGGLLDVKGTIDLDDSARAYDSKILITDLTVLKAPTLARILSLASTSGIQNVISSEGLHFDRIEVEIAGRDGEIEIRDAVGNGKALSILVSGRLDTAENKARLRGTLVPDYYGLNRLIKDTPVLNLLLAEKRHGLLAIDFTVRGPLDKPDVSVDPLRSLTPGVVRRLGNWLSGDESKK